MIELRRLHAFVAVAEERQMTRAAERLGMAQPPLSRLVRGLEAELGVTLVRRLPRGVELTDAGQALFEEARTVLARTGRIADTVRRVARGEQGRLAIGFTSSAALHPFVPAALLAFRDVRPGVRTELEEAGTMELVDAMLQGRLDAAFIRTPVERVEGLIVDHVLDEPMVAAMPAGHELVRSGVSPLPLTALAGEPFILYRRPAGPGLYDAIVTACRGAGFSPTVEQEAPRLPSTLSLVAAGLGISIVPESMKQIAMPGVAFRALQGCPGLSAPINLALRRSGFNATASRFREMVHHLATRRDANHQDCILAHG